jgi:D-alanyl-D-alanine dipeptidase
MTCPFPLIDVTTVDPTIIPHLRYLGSENFLGRPVVGYHANIAYLSPPAAAALARASASFAADGFRIVVYDAYRPQRAVNSFFEWAADAMDQVRWYPKGTNMRIWVHDILVRSKTGIHGSHTGAQGCVLPAYRQSSRF